MLFQKFSEHFFFGFLSCYYNIEDAAAVRKEAEDALFGNFLEWFQEVYPERWEKFNNNKKDGK